MLFVIIKYNESHKVNAKINCCILFYSHKKISIYYNTCDSYL